MILSDKKDKRQGRTSMNDLIEKWDNILETVRAEYELSDISFKTWIRPLKPEYIEGNTVYILVGMDQEQAIDYIRNKYLLPLRVTIAEKTGHEYDLEFINSRQLQEEKPKSKINMAEILNLSNLNPNYTFESFIVGKNNNFAYNASLAVSESPGEVYNPLFLYGDVGLGKTHLMQSIAHFILENNPKAKVIYVTSEYFTNELIEAIRNSNPSALTKFRDKYRSIDALLIDDIQFIIGKESTQEEFFHTFNALHSNNKQIIISSDKPPKDIETLEERLKTRFEWGLIADISAPDYETRMAILRKKMELTGYTDYIIEDEVIRYIAENVKSNIRELEGALNKLIAFARLENRNIDMDAAQEALKDIINPNEKRAVTPELIINTVAEHFQISVNDITGRKKSAQIAYPRQVAMYLCRSMTDTTLEATGAYLGGKNHTTVSHGVEKIEQDMKENENTRVLIETIKKKINPS